MALMSKQENAIAEESPYKYEPISIIPHLYLGSELNAADRGMLNRLKIEYILNVAKEVDIPYQAEVISSSGDVEMEDTSPGLSSSSSLSFNSSHSSESFQTVVKPCPQLHNSQ